MRLSSDQKRRIHDRYLAANRDGELYGIPICETGVYVERLPFGAGDESVFLFRLYGGGNALPQIFAANPDRGALYLGYEDEEGNLVEEF